MAVKKTNVAIIASAITISAILFYGVIYGFHRYVDWFSGLSPETQTTLKIILPIVAVGQLVLFALVRKAKKHVA